MINSWRPEGWKNPHIEDLVIYPLSVAGQITFASSEVYQNHRREELIKVFEAGADAMLVKIPDVLKVIGVPQRFINDFILFCGLTDN